ncbi:MAG TPA: 6-phosphogluconolactonase [Steroidobacteraceae bacterium]|nr:6-phosphogluconolactonase [Steroidobacteraceae bacterium]
MNTEPPAVRYPDLDILSQQLAAGIAADLAAAIEARGMASLVVSGGRSPVKLFERLRTLAIDWGRVCVALADERWVDPSDPASNERLVRDVLLRDAAAAARFTGLKNGCATADLGADMAWSTFNGVPRPFDALVLGMGDDGHTASLFPDSPNLERALDEAAAAGCVGMRSPIAPEARLSLNLAALLDSRRIVILITGESKWRTYIAALQPGAAERMPVRAVLRQQHAPVEVIWSP